MLAHPGSRLDRWRADHPGIRRQRFLPVVAFVAAVALLVPAAVTADSDRNLVNLWLAYSLAAIGFYWIFGVAGRFAFCQTMAMALGGYLTAWAAREGWPFWTGLVLAVLATGAAAAVIGFVLRRATDLAFAIGTVAVLEAGHVMLARTSSFTGQHGDVTNIGYPTWFGSELVTEGQVFWLFLGTLAGALLLSVALDRSPLHRTLVAGRQNTLVARTLGQPVVARQVMMFALGSGLGALSGALMAHWQGVTGVNSFGLDLAIGIFLMVILGGRHSVWGGVIGAAFYIWLPELLSGFDRYRPIVYATVLLVAIVVFPNGLVGVFRQVCDAVGGRRSRAVAR